MKIKEKFKVGELHHLIETDALTTTVQILQGDYLVIRIHQANKDLNTGVEDHKIIYIEQGMFAPFYELIEKALWKCLDIEADAALKFEQDAAN